jgi:hypothetical protein
MAYTTTGSRSTVPSCVDSQSDNSMDIGGGVVKVTGGFVKVTGGFPVVVGRL